MAFEMLLRRISSLFTAHGFRSSFRNWADNETNFPPRACRYALAHVIGDKAEQAYRRGDGLARPRELMDAWAWHCYGGAGENPLLSSPLPKAAKTDCPSAIGLSLGRPCSAGGGMK
jgi:hypothetical protein